MPEESNITSSIASRGILDQLARGVKHGLDEAAFFTGGAVGGYLMNYFRGRGQAQKAEVVDKARALYTEGKHDEARELIIQSHLFGIGHGDECGMLATLAFVIQFFLDADEEALIGPFLNALDALDEETLERLRLSLAVIESVEERGKMMVKLAKTPGNLRTRIRQHCRIAGIVLDPANHPANVLVDAIGGAFTRAFTGRAAKLQAERNRLRAARIAPRP